jgi:alkaline phosphatase
MIKQFFALPLFLAVPMAEAQHYTSSSIFAHNDYARPVPFHTAYNLRVGYIEADVFLKEDDLLVAHAEDEIEEERTLRALYLEPLLEQIVKNDGFVYPDHDMRLTLMVDLKTEGIATLSKLVEILSSYPKLLQSSTLNFLISGNVPSPREWKNYPSYIYFDGRPGIRYSPEELQRISMISTSFRQHVEWDGTGTVPSTGQQKIVALMKQAHSSGKKFRFWATPDTENAWQELMRLNMDVIVTDNPAGLDGFLKRKKQVLD